MVLLRFVACLQYKARIVRFSPPLLPFLYLPSAMNILAAILLASASILSPVLVEAGSSCSGSNQVMVGVTKVSLHFDLLSASARCTEPRQ